MRIGPLLSEPRITYRPDGRPVLTSMSNACTRDPPAASENRPRVVVRISPWLPTSRGVSVYRAPAQGVNRILVGLPNGT